jgi:hypothetical protein
METVSFDKFGIYGTEFTALHNESYRYLLDDPLCKQALRVFQSHQKPLLSEYWYLTVRGVAHDLTLLSSWQEQAWDNIKKLFPRKISQFKKVKEDRKIVDAYNLMAKIYMSYLQMYHHRHELQ